MPPKAQFERQATKKDRNWVWVWLLIFLPSCTRNSLIVFHLDPFGRHVPHNSQTGKSTLALCLHAEQRIDGLQYRAGVT